MVSCAPTTGDRGEDLAISHLLDEGYRIAERNWRAGQAGEIDVIAWDGPVLAFIEIKTRRRDTCGPPEAGLTPFKQRQIASLAKRYLYRSGLYGTVDCRFDLIAVRFAAGGPRIEHITDAFRT
jgi:putative endonuclease